MLNLHRLAPDAESYYLDQVVSGVEDYYAEAGESPGYWLASSHLHGLDGVVDGDDLRAVLSGLDPETGERLHRARNRKVPGWDLTFRAPKSVSILWGLGEPQVARMVADAHDAAVDRAVAYMEEVAAFTRTGRNGTHRVPADGFIAAGFRHRTSRDRDPLLHTHVLVANSLRTADGRWRTIDATALYDHARTAGYLYQAHLRNELTERIGVVWTPIHGGLADIAGIDEELIDLFSKRREQIELTMAEWGLTSAKAAQVSTLETRAAKVVSPERTPDQQARWRSEALTIGVSTADLAVVMADHQVPSIDADETTALFNRLSSSSGLTETYSTFDRRDVLRRVIDELPAAVPVEVIESLGSQYLQRLEVVAVGWEERTGTSFSTIELMALEQDLVALVHDGVDADRAVASPGALASAFDARPSVSPEQAHVVTEICSSGRSVDVLVAAAGTGKTFSLDAAQEAWQRTSYRVVGCALAASAAHELQAGSGIPSSPIAKLTLDLERDRQWLDRRTVLVIDEAGMVGTRALAPLLQTAVASGAKVVLVGDPKQLPEIKTGGVLASLERRHPILTLTENHRQQDTVEREALDQLRSGDVERAMRSLREHGDVVAAPNAEAVRDGMVGDWFRHRNDGRASLMMARRNADVDDLNRRARQLVAAAGELSGEPVIVGGRPFQVGDHVVCTRNDYPNGVRNGTVGEITAIDHGATTVTICTEEGDRTLGRDYLAAGSMRHGYAVTVHKAQGRTCDHGLLLASDDLHREMGYVGLSRGRESNRMYVVSTEPADGLERYGRHEEHADPYDLVVESLHKTAAKELAIDRADPDLGADDDLDVGW